MRDALPTRRQLLAGGAAVATVASAGCLGVFASDDASDPESSPLQLALAPEDGPLHETRVVESGDRPDRWADGVLEAAIASETFTTQYRKPFFAGPDDPVYVHHEGTYYELGSVIVDEATETRPVLRLTTLDDDGESSDAIAHEELPDGDRNAVRVAQMAARARGNVGGVPWGLVQRDGYVYRDAVTIEESVVLADDGPDRISFRDRVYEVSVSREEFHEPIYRATAERLTTAADRMEAILRARFVDARFGRDALSSDARDVFREAARPEGYEETHPYSDAFQELLTAMHKQAYLDGNIRKDAGRFEPTGMIRYDGEYYEYRIEFTA